MDKKDRRIAELETLLRNALERIVELERRLGLNSTNSSKLPSSDGFRKKPSPKSLRITGQNPSGGQKGHKGHTLDRVETPDKVVIYGVDSCRSCQKSCADIPVSKRTSRQVKDIPQSHIDVTEHQIKKICSFGCVNTRLFPKGATAPVQYGERISALSVYLSVQQLIPEDRLQTLFADVFDLNIATATLFMITGNPTDVLHALCNAHPQALKELAAIYDEIVSEGFTYHNSKYPFAKPARGSQKRHKGHNLLIRFRDFKLAILSCLSDFLVPFTNNLAEQDIRMMKLKQKISGAFRTLQGAQGFCTIRSFIFTHRKLNHNLFRSIQLALA